MDFRRAFIFFCFSLLAAARLFPADTGRLSNVSARAHSTAGEGALIAGVVLAGDQPGVLLARSAGPSLLAYGVPDVMPDPAIAVFAGNALVQELREGSAGDPAVIAAASRVHAFPLTAVNDEEGAVLSLAPGGYTVHAIPEEGTTGEVLLELYDAAVDPAASAHIANFSIRTQLSAAHPMLIAGFVVSGAPRRVLLRAVGPGLAQHGVTGPLQNPRLALYGGQLVLSRNNDWNTSGDSAPLAAAMSTAGAFALDAHGADAGLVVDLAPGSYTAHIDDVAGGAGIVLLELYDLGASPADADLLTEDGPAEPDGSGNPGDPPHAPLEIEPEATVLQVLTLREVFGVPHPTQIVDFDLPAPLDPAEIHVVGPEGTRVPFQILSGRRLAVATGLAAGETRQWQVIAGRASAPDTELRVLTRAEEFEITNGLTGIRLPRETIDLAQQPGPIRGIRLASGAWVGTGTNPLPFRPALLQVRMLENGPLRVEAQIEYRFSTAAINYGAMAIAPAGEKFYRVTIALEAGAPAIVIEEDTDWQFNTSFNLHAPAVFAPTQRRYQGEHASSEAAGRNVVGGGIYLPMHQRGNSDALMDFQFATDHPSNSDILINGRSYVRRTNPWDPWRYNAGWWEVVYDAAAGPEGDMLGIFQGQASRALGIVDAGVGFFTKAGDAATRQVGLTLAHQLRGPDNRLAARIRYQWAIYAGTRGELTDTGVQAIHRQMNRYGGFNLGKVHRYQTAFSDPETGYGALYKSHEAMAAMIERIRTDRTYRNYLYNTVTETRPVIELWEDASGAKLQAAIADVTGTATSFLDHMVNGYGIYTSHLHYWKGGLRLNRLGLWIDQILADPRTTLEERGRVKAAAALFAYILADQDFVPLETFGTSGNALNAGTANMPIMQRGYRDFYALFLSHHPDFARLAQGAAANALATLDAIVNDAGAEIGCTHYIAPSIQPTINTLLQLKQRGIVDAFATEPKLARFAEFYMQLQTPPEPRLDAKRGFIALGDSSIEPTELLGMLGTGFRGVNDELSERLMGLWRENGSPQSDFFGASNFSIDDRLPGRSPDLGSAQFDGYLSALRSGWGTADESAAWLVAGEHYFDHRHPDRNSVVLYALAQPLSNTWPTIYYPNVTGAYTKNAVVFADSLTTGWAADSASITEGTKWIASATEAFTPGATGSYARSHASHAGTTWVRELTLAHADNAHPIYFVRDTFSGPREGDSKVLTFNLEAAGPVITPVGTMTPPSRLHPAREHQAGDPLPSATAPFAVGAGAQQFSFSGTQGIDFDVFTINAGATQAILGNWGVTIWGGAARNRPLTQHILRVQGTGAFATVIVPFRKGARPADLAVSQNGGNVVVEQNGTTVVFGANGVFTVAP